MRNKKKKITAVKLADQEEYIKNYQRLSHIISQYSVHICSDSTEVNLVGWKHHVRKVIEHLPDEEQIMILERYQRFGRLKQQLGSYVRQIKKTSEDTHGVILESRKAELLEMFGMYYSREEIHKKLTEDGGMVLHMRSIKKFQAKYRLEIEKLQSDYDQDYGTIGVSRKRSRLEQLDYMLRRTKQEYDVSSAKNILPYGKEIRSILEQARKEVEGEQIHLNVDGSINITASIESAKSVEELYSDINFMNLLIARVAARMKINPLLLQYQLTNSWYSKFTGIKRNDSLMDDIPDYPSKIIMNWTDLKKKADSKAIEIRDVSKKFTEQVQDVEVLEEEKAQEYREKLRKQVKTKQAYVDSTKDRLKGEKTSTKNVKELIAQIKAKNNKDK